LHNLDCETAIDPLTAAGGESGTTPALAVIIGAIVDAISAYGIRYAGCRQRRSPCGRLLRTPKRGNRYDWITQLHGREIAAARLSLTQTS
jgi:hypothetical protein